MRYFPDPFSGWIFLAALGTVLAIASYTDQRTMKVPKWLSIPALGVGLLVSLLRGIWLASHDYPVWILGDQGPWLGAVDGLLFALAGSVVGFVLFLIMWMMGVCGGGDVKLFTAIGAWVGPTLVIAILAASLLLLWVYILGMFAVRLLWGRGMARSLPGRQGGMKSREPIIIRYSLIATMAAIPVLLWTFRNDLQLVPARPSTTSAAEVRHAS
ncbi:MAG: A24 family peptidase [Gemmataceae bacterium]